MLEDHFISLLVTLLTGVVALLVTVLGFMIKRLYGRIDYVEVQLTKKDTECEQRFTRLDGDLHKVKEELPKNYATKDDLNNMQSNILSNISTLSNGIGDLRKDIVDLVKQKQDK